MGSDYVLCEDLLIALAGYGRQVLELCAGDSLNQMTDPVTCPWIGFPLWAVFHVIHLNFEQVAGLQLLQFCLDIGLMCL